MPRAIIKEESCIVMLDMQESAQTYGRATGGGVREMWRENSFAGRSKYGGRVLLKYVRRDGQPARPIYRVSNRHHHGHRRNGTAARCAL